MKGLTRAQLTNKEGEGAGGGHGTPLARKRATKRRNLMLLSFALKKNLENI